MILEQEIHEHPLAQGVKRWVKIINNWNGSTDKVFDLFYQLRYEKDGIDVSSQFDTSVKMWRTDNSRMMFERDLSTFEKIPNPNYDAENEMSFETEFLMQPAYDYTNFLVTQAPIPSGVLIKKYILEEAQDGRFDQ